MSVHPSNVSDHIVINDQTCELGLYTLKGSNELSKGTVSLSPREFREALEKTASLDPDSILGIVTVGIVTITRMGANRYRIGRSDNTLANFLVTMDGVKSFKKEAAHHLQVRDFLPA